MSRLLTETLRSTLPKLREQESSKDPIVHAMFFFPGSGWKWFVIEGESNGDDFIFFGYVIGFEAEFESFTLRELEELDIHGVRVESAQDFELALLTDCISTDRFDEQRSG